MLLLLLQLMVMMVMRMMMMGAVCTRQPYLDAGVAGLRLGLDADVRPAVLLAVAVRVVARVAVLVRDDGGDGLGRIGLDEEPVQRGRGALRDGGGLVRRVGFVRVPAVDHPALRDVDAGSAAHASLGSRLISADARVPPSCRPQLPAHRLLAAARIGRGLGSLSPPRTDGAHEASEKRWWWRGGKDVEVSPMVLIHASSACCGAARSDVMFLPLKK